MNRSVKVEEKRHNQHPELKARYLKELTNAWMNEDCDNITTIIVAHAERLRSMHDLDRLGDCTAYHLMIGSTPPVTDLDRVRALYRRLNINRSIEPFFDFEGNESILAFVENVIHESMPETFRRIRDEHLERIKAHEMNHEVVSDPQRTVGN